ncbi:MAG: hypothetical protein QG597_4078, partial [Actinomycetota bacterium]|nr:hypothetical protein [Actinomycetota bacterium]
ADVKALLAEHPPTHVASILAQYRRETLASEQSLEDYPIPRLQQLLYRGPSWRQGRLATAVAKMSFGAALLGKEVSVVTTNYDTHIEQQIRREIDLARREGDPDVQADLHVMDGTGACQSETQPAVGLPVIRMRYLHGRVPPAPESGASRIVISEVDYAETRSANFEVLSGLFNEADAVIIVGASLTDPPLIEALATTRRRMQEPQADDSQRRDLDVGVSHRYCLIPLEATGVAHHPAPVTKRLASHLKQRGLRLGVTLLLPDFKMQVTQFCEEVGLHYSSAATAEPERYGQRLVRWWEQWNGRVAAGAGDELAGVYAHEVLAAALESIRDVVRASEERTGCEHAGEVLRLELWARSNPAEDRRLSMYATSAGSVQDHSVMSSAALDVHSSHASVRAFIDGRPQFHDRQELEAAAQRSLRVTDPNEAFRYKPRWASYLSVPVTVRSGDGHVSVGVVTLASDRTRAESGVNLADVTESTRVLNILKSAGKRILLVDADAGLQWYPQTYSGGVTRWVRGASSLPRLSPSRRLRSGRSGA